MANAETKICQNCKKSFEIQPEDFAFYEKMKVPPPTWCPDCRMMRRMLFRNQRLLFRRKDDATGNNIISGIPPGAPLKVYDVAYWWTDQWDPSTYERDYDFSRPFFEQFRDLLQSVPVFSRSVISMANGDYCDQAGFVKNSYLCFDFSNSENCAYVVNGEDVRDSMDVYHAEENELCYEDVMSDRNYQVFYSVDCQDCRDVWFSKDCGNCANCFGCAGLRNKSFHIFNEPYTKEAYFEKLKEYDLGSRRAVAEIRKKAEAFWLRFPVKFMHGFQNVDVSGEAIEDSKNVHNSYFVGTAENVRYGQVLWDKTVDSYDYFNFGLDATRMYECVTCGAQTSNIRFSWECWNAAHDIEYSAFCSTSSNLFGCVGLRSKQYCIFNKQYSKEEFEALREKIIQQMNDMPYTDRKGRVYRYGEFFPIELSPLAYNETTTQDFFPITKEIAEERGYVWRDPELRDYQTTKKGSELPDHIKDVPDSVVGEVIECSSCQRPYQVIPMELAFYRRIGIPAPELCPSCRFLKRLPFVNPPKFWHRKCQCAGAVSIDGVYKNQIEHFHGADACPNEFETAYAPEKPDIVYCAQCYQSEIL